MSSSTGSAIFSGPMGQITAHRKHKTLADSAYESKQFRDAKKWYLQAAQTLIGTPIEIPLEINEDGNNVQWIVYAIMDPGVKMFLMACYNGLSKTCLMLHEIEEALSWAEETRFLAFTTRLRLPVPLFEWIRYTIDIPQITKELVIALVSASEIFELLGNTASAVDRRWNMGTESLDDRHVTPEVKKIRNTKKLYEIISLRHPDPSTWVLEKNINKKKGAMKPRLAFASFIWNSKLYVGGGLGNTKGPAYRDMCCLDLETLDTWRSLPPYPGSEHLTGVWMCWNFSIYDDKAYLFTGKDDLDYFDLRTETWKSIGTTNLAAAIGSKNSIRPRAPLYDLKETAQQVVGHNLYVFGGTHQACMIGCNLFLRLNLKTMEWKKLSGYFKPGQVADYLCPGPRKTPCMWVDGRKERLYLFGGECNRSAGEITGELHAASHGYAYEDFWSWDIRNEDWRMERLVGNVPCPRSEAACTYNSEFDKAIIFGGYNPAFGTQFDNNFFPFAYFADTFMYFPATARDAGSPESAVVSTMTPTVASSSISASKGKWKQILTRGFPTYRAQSQLLTDPKTGKTYLFGGYVNTDWVPSGKSSKPRTFGDLWQLCVDIPGGYFEDVDIAEEAKTAKIGPWQRCFACGSAGRWRKCGGSCKGRAFFCDSECLKEGWKQHKEMHTCRKVT